MTHNGQRTGPKVSGRADTANGPGGVPLSPASPSPVARSTPTRHVIAASRFASAKSHGIPDVIDCSCGALVEALPVYGWTDAHAPIEVAWRAHRTEARAEPAQTRVNPPDASPERYRPSPWTRRAL